MFFLGTHYYQSIKSFIRPHLDYGDIIYDQSNNQAFSNKLEAVQYNAVLAITALLELFEVHQRQKFISAGISAKFEN